MRSKELFESLEKFNCILTKEKLRCPLEGEQELFVQ